MNKFFLLLNKITDCIYLSILWALFCLPVLTAGAATTALYYTAHKTLRKNRGHIRDTFLGAFRRNFKRATKMWLVILAFFLVAYMNYQITLEQLKQKTPLGMLCYFFIALLLFTAVWGVCVFAYTAKFESGIKSTMKNAALISIAYLPWSLLILLLLAAGVLAVYLSPVLLLLIPAGVACIFDWIFEKIFRRYIYFRKKDPEED